MKLAIMQPYFFPYIGYFQAIHAVDKYFIYNNLNYIKKSWMNRNRIMLRNYGPFYIVVPLLSISSNKKIYEIEICNNFNWRKKLINTISHNYKNAVFYDEVFPLVSDIINYDNQFLFELNEYGIKKIANFLNIKTQILNVSNDFVELENKLNDHQHNLIQYFRYWNINCYEKKVIRVLEICKSVNADVYVNAIGGQSLYSKDEFKKNGISLYFVNTNSDLKYKQLSDIFYPGLSIIDVMMNCGKEGTIDLLNKYTLI